MSINAETTLEEIAALVSEALSKAGIDAVLSGGAAVTIYSENQYMSTDLDFVTTERNKVITPVVGELGFVRVGKIIRTSALEVFHRVSAGPFGLW